MEDKAKAEIIMDLAQKFNVSLPDGAGILEYFLDKGWSPAYPDPTPEQEVDILDRIKHGRPVEYLKPANPVENLPIPMPDNTPFIVEEYMEAQGKKVSSMVNEWVRLPEFPDYEANRIGVIRSRWTKRPVDIEPTNGHDYADLHDKEGHPHMVSVEHIVASVFNK